MSQIAQNFDQTLVAGNIKSAMRDVDGKSRDLWFVAPESLVILEDFNVRPKDESYTITVREIADSIKQNGFYAHKPFACIALKRDGKDIIAVFDGHTRYDGLQLAISEGAKIERVPVVTSPAGTTLEDIKVGLVTNNSGRSLPPMGIAVVCKRLVGYGLDNSTIASRLGYTPAYVGGLLSLMGAPKQIRDMVNDGKVAASLAISTLREEGEKAVAVLQTGLKVAADSGKTKVTKKNLTPVVVKEKELSVLDKGLEWISKNGSDDKSFELLSAVTGKSVSQLKSLI